MSLLFTLKIAWQAMNANKVRTGLTVLGMVIGIMAVIIVFSAGEGVKSLIVGQIESFGTDIIETEVKVPSSKKGMAADQQSASSLAQGLQITTLTLEDMKAVMKLPNIRNGYGGIMSQEQVSYGNQLRKAFVLGVNASFIDIDKSEIDYGRFFTEPENRSLAKVAVLGSKMKEKLFGDSDPIGRFIKLRQKKFRVVGVMKERGAVMVMDFDDYIYVPVRTLQKRIMGINHITYMVHQLYDIDQAEATAEEVRAILRQRHNITDETKDDFRVTTMTEMMSTLDTITSALTLLLLAIVIISLVVGGVGIMNIMYVIITERTAEIGLRKAMGARQVDILKQFLLEAILVSLIGAVIGVSFGVLASFLVAWGASSAGLDWRFAVPVKSFVVAILFSLVAGVLFGVWPARKAARLDPIEALRAE